MIAHVHILATHLDGEAIEGTLLVFRTLRVGFPTADVHIWGNGLSLTDEHTVRSAAVRCSFTPLSLTSHDRWIASLLDNSLTPFWVCDTDMVFHASVEAFVSADAAISGRYEPPFIEPWSKTNKVDRLHTSLLWLDPVKIRSAVREWLGQWHPKGFPFLPMVELIAQHYVPCGAANAPLFYDTCAGLFQAIGGQRFTEEQNAAFDHLHCATYVGRMNEAVKGLAAAHASIYRGQLDAPSLRQSQRDFYAAHA